MSHPNSFALDEEDVFLAIRNMMNSEDHQPVKEGNVGQVKLVQTACVVDIDASYSGGTSMVSFGLKGGTGTSSRLVPNADGGSFTVGVLVQVSRLRLYSDARLNWF